MSPNDAPDSMIPLTLKEYWCDTPEKTFALGESVGRALRGGEVLLLTGPLGAGKTLFTKGVLQGLDFDVDEVTSPSFTLVNQYDARLPVYHLDLWRIEDPAGAPASVGLHDLLDEEDAVIIIEWAERLGDFAFPDPPLKIRLEGDGDAPRLIAVER